MNWPLFVALALNVIFVYAIGLTVQHSRGTARDITAVFLLMLMMLGVGFLYVT